MGRHGPRRSRLRRAAGDRGVRALVARSSCSSMRAAPRTPSRRSASTAAASPATCRSSTASRPSCPTAPPALAAALRRRQASPRTAASSRRWSTTRAADGLPVLCRRDRGLEQARYAGDRQGRRRGCHRHRHRRPDEGLRGGPQSEAVAGRRHGVGQPPNSPRQATGSATARTSRASSPATRSRPTTCPRQVRGRRPRGQPDLRQGLRRPRQRDDPRRHLRLAFVVDFKDQYNIRVVNLSLSRRRPQSYKTDPLDAAVESAWLKGSWSSPPPATAAPPPTPSSTRRATTRT